jgi:hypothetical protein
MSLRKLSFALMLPGLLSLGCSHAQERVAPVAVRAADLAGATYNVVAKNAQESTILLGTLQLGAVTDGRFTGQWTLRSWSGGGVPGLPGSGALSGRLFGGTVVLDLDLGAGNSLGLLSDGFARGRLSGSALVSPDGAFRGTFEAIRASAP